MQQDINHIKTQLDSGFQELRLSAAFGRTMPTWRVRSRNWLLQTVRLQRKWLRCKPPFNSTVTNVRNSRKKSLDDRNKTFSSLKCEFEELTKNSKGPLDEPWDCGVPESRDENVPDIVLAVASHAGVAISTDDIVEVKRVTPSCQSSRDAQGI